MITRPQRFYPQGSLAAHVLGIAGIDNQGLEGLEYHYDEYLSGTPGTMQVEKMQCSAAYQVAMKT